MKNKKFFLFAIFWIFTSKLSAETFIIEYSEWSENYPKGVDEWIVESEERYKWTDGEDITEEYYNNYKEGYYKLENDYKTYYRYITNDTVVVDSQNNFVTNLDYCKKEKCYIIKLDKYRNIEEEPEIPEEPETPEEPEVSEEPEVPEAPEEPEVSEEPEAPETPEEAIIYNPKTADNILYYDILLFSCLISIVLVIYKQKIILVLSKRFKKIKNNCNIES